MAPGRQISSFECSVCSVTMESWNTAWVPTYRLVAGPVRDVELGLKAASVSGLSSQAAPALLLPSHVILKGAPALLERT